MCSVSRIRAASSPLPQAFNRYVISPVRVSMDTPFTPWASKTYTRNVAAFGRLLPAVPLEGEQAVGMISSHKRQETTHEIHSNRDTDAQPRCRRHLRATGSLKHDGFGYGCGQHDQSTVRQTC